MPRQAQRGSCSPVWPINAQGHASPKWRGRLFQQNRSKADIGLAAGSGPSVRRTNNRSLGFSAANLSSPTRRYLLQEGRWRAKWSALGCDLARAGFARSCEVERRAVPPPYQSVPDSPTLSGLRCLEQPFCKGERGAGRLEGRAGRAIGNASAVRWALSRTSRSSRKNTPTRPCGSSLPISL